MRDKSNKTIEFRAGKADKNFTEERLTSYTGLTVVSKYIQAQGIGKLLDRLFPTVKQNATKFSTTQIMLAVVLASMADVHRMSRIENFTCDPLVQHLLSLKEDIDQDTLIGRGYFNGELFDLLENEGHDYLVKVKLKNLSRLMLEQKWLSINEKESVCEFEYQAKDWKKSRTLRGIRILTGYKHTNFFGEITIEPEYEYFCYCSNLNDKDGEALHELYKKRAESENWIEQTKNQLHASQTLTDDFSANDILWQLSVLGYNLSVMMRYEANSKIWRQEHLTYFRWFINVPGKVVKTARKVTVKMSRHYWYADQWRDFEQRLSIAC